MPIWLLYTFISDLPLEITIFLIPICSIDLDTYSIQITHILKFCCPRDLFDLLIQELDITLVSNTQFYITFSYIIATLKSEHIVASWAFFQQIVIISYLYQAVCLYLNAGRINSKPVTIWILPREETF